MEVGDITEDNIDFKNIPISVRLAIAKRKIFAMQSQIEMYEKMVKDRIAEVIKFKDENKELLQANIELHRKAIELEVKVNFLQKNNQPTKDEILKMKKSDLYLELTNQIKSRDKKIKALTDTKRELTQTIISIRLKVQQ